MRGSSSEMLPGCWSSTGRVKPTDQPGHATGANGLVPQVNATFLPKVTYKESPAGPPPLEEETTVPLSTGSLGIASHLIATPS